MSTPSPELDQQMLRRAIRLAMNGRGHVEPNPMVGCVIIKNGRVIGEGFHARFGEAHAEPAALENCTESPEGATAYVTLEPCCHTNKKTPPCVPRLMAARIARVVIGTLDPNPEVNGQGVAMLRSGGVEVTTGVLEAEAKQLLAPFIATTMYRRPYVTLKWAESRNGKVAGPRGERVQITNEASTRLVHQLRARCDAILVGTNTVLNDDPLLTARAAGPSSRGLLRVVLSNTLKIAASHRLVQTARQQPLIVYSSMASVSNNAAHVASLRDLGAEVVALPDHEGRFAFRDVLSDLHARGVTNVLVEPGPTLTHYFLQRGQADRVWVFRSPRDIQDGDGLAIAAAPMIEYASTGVLDLDGDVLTEYLNPASQVYFALTPSADIVLAK